MRKHDIELSQADGKRMTIERMVRLSEKIGGRNSVHKLYVIPDLYGDMILGKTGCGSIKPK